MNELLSTDELVSMLGRPGLVVVDTRWIMGQPGAGREAWLAERIPSSVHLDLDCDLAEIGDGSRGRHPLPAPERFARTLGDAGIGPDTLIVAYDHLAGAIAARLWWMMEWIRGPQVALLDGGIVKWKAEGRPVEHGRPSDPRPTPRLIEPRPRADMLADRDEIQERRRDMLLLDARDPDRFRGDYEPVDSVAGHVPGARSAPFRENLTATEVPVFLPGSALRTRYEALGAESAEDVICYCGSGVTACHNLFALRRSGYVGARLYPGSWSEWSRYNEVATGPGEP